MNASTNQPSNAISITVELSKDVMGDGKWYMTIARDGAEPFDGISEAGTAHDAIINAEALMSRALEEWANAIDLVWLNSRGEVVAR